MGVSLAKTDRVSALCLSLIVGLATLLDVFVAKSMSTTYDEPQSVAYGEQVLRGHPDRSDPLFNSKEPIAALNALPRALADYFNRPGTSPVILKTLRSFRLARLASVLATLLLNFFVYRWARELYGSAAAIAASIMVVFSPNLVAHGTLSNNDGYFALGVVMSLYFFRRYILHPTIWNASIGGFTLALAQLTKPFALYLYAIILVFLVLISQYRDSSLPSVTRKQVINFVSIAFLMVLMALNAGFCFDRTFTPLKQYHFDTRTFALLQQVPVLRSLPLPLPYPFLQGLDMLKHHDDSGLTYGKIYLLGELRDPYDPNFHSFKSYYAVAMFFKEPIPLHILFCLGLFWIFRNRKFRDFLAGEGLLLAAAIVLFVWFSLFRKSELGIRNILPVVAIDVMIAAAAFANFSQKPRSVKAMLSLLVLWMCLSTMSYYPNLIAYMNEWMCDRTQAYKILVDSNLDFGQEGDIVREFLMRNPDVVFDPEVPTPGRILVSVNRLVGEWHGYEPMYWLLRYQPSGRVGYGHLLFLVPAADVTTVNSKPRKR